MVSAITFRANESTGGVADRTVDTAKNETTGGVGVRRNNNDSIFTLDNELKQDTVSFRARPEEKKSSATGIVLFLTGLTTLFVGAALAHKYDLVGYVKNEKVKNALRHTDVVTKPCHEACAWIKHNSYDKLVKMFKSK